MAAPQALEKVGGQGPEDINQDVAAPQVDVSDFIEYEDGAKPAEMKPMAAPSGGQWFPPMAAPSVQQPQIQQNIPEWMGGGMEMGAQYTPEDLDKLLDAGAIGSSIALGVAFPALGALGIATTEGALSYIKDTLKNQYNPEDKQIGGPKKFFNAVISGATAGAGAKASQWLLGKIIGDAAKTGDEAILNAAEEAYKQEVAKSGVKSAIETAESAGVRLTPAEAFPFDAAAQVQTADVLREHPKIGIQFAKRLGQYKDAIRNLFADATPMESSKTIRDFFDETVKSSRQQIGSIQKQLNQAGADIADIRSDGDSLLSLLDQRMKQINGNLDNDILNAQAPEMNTIRNELSNALKRSRAGEFVDYATGVRVKDKGLTLSDIEKFRDRISNLVDSAYTKLGKNQQLSNSEQIAKSMYRDVAALRDQMSEQIANKIGRPELAAELKSLRSNYAQKIDAWETIRDQLANAPADELKYLFKKNDPALAGQIVSVLDDGQKQAVKQTFVTRLLDPTYLREAGEDVASNEVRKNVFTTAKNLLDSYDEGVLKAIYSPEELASIRQFLSLGKSAEKVISGSTKNIEKASPMKRLLGMALNPKEAFIVRPIMEAMAPGNPIKRAMDYQLYLAGKRSAGEVGADVAQSLGATAPEALEVAKTQALKARAGLQEALPEKAKELIRRAGVGAGRGYGRSMGQKVGAEGQSE
jgi:hypothetical protein